MQRVAGRDIRTPDTDARPLTKFSKSELARESAFSRYFIIVAMKLVARPLFAYFRSH